MNMIVQKKSSDQRTVQAGYVAMVTSQGHFALYNKVTPSTFFKNQIDSTVNFGDQSPRDKVSAAATKVHNETAGEHTRQRQRISHHKRGIGLNFCASQDILLTPCVLGKKSYLLPLKRTLTKNLLAA